MARSLPHDYETAAGIFYDAGRLAKRSGEPRTDSHSATNPNNPAAWDQTYKTDLSLTGSPLKRQFGDVDLHWWYGWDDEAAGWPSRGYRLSLSKGYNNPPINYDGTEASKGRLFYLRWIYIAVWKDPDPKWGRGGVNPLPIALNFLTQDEINWECDQARTDKTAPRTPPQLAYYDPSTAGIPAKGAAPPATTSQSNEYPFQGYNWDAVLRSRAQQSSGGPGGLNFSFGGGMANVWPLLLL